MDRSFAKQLRRQSTEAEKRLWAALRSRQLSGAKFRRQVPIGPYVADFVCPAASLVIEIDGGQHGSQAEDDARRSECLAREGYRVVRFWNNEVMDNLPGVLETIMRELSE